jgi:hypothetical protein
LKLLWAVCLSPLAASWKKPAVLLIKFEIKLVVGADEAEVTAACAIAEPTTAPLLTAAKGTGIPNLTERLFYQTVVVRRTRANYSTDSVSFKCPF